MTAFLLVLKSTWKIWVPALAVLLIGGTLWAQQSRIKSLKNQRDVAIVEHDRAMEQQTQLLADIDRLDALLLSREAVVKKLEVDLANAKKRIAALAAQRPDVVDWLAAPLPAGLWSAANDHPPSQSAAGADPTGSGPADRAEDERGVAQPLP